MRSYSYGENFKKFKGTKYDKDGSFMWSVYTDNETTKGREVNIVTKDEIICYRASVAKSDLAKQKQARREYQQQREKLKQQGQLPKKQESDGVKVAKEVGKAALEMAGDILLDSTMREQGMSHNVDPSYTGPFTESNKSLNNMSRFFKWKGKKVKTIEPRRDRCQIALKKTFGSEVISATEEEFDEILSHIRNICPNATIVG